MDSDTQSSEILDKKLTIRPESELTTLSGLVTTEYSLEDILKEITAPETLESRAPITETTVPVILEKDITTELHTEISTEKIKSDLSTKISLDEITVTKERDTFVVTEKEIITSLEYATEIQKEDADTISVKNMTTMKDEVDVVHTIKPKITSTRILIPFPGETDISTKGPFTIEMDRLTTEYHSETTAKPELDLATFTKIMTTESILDETTLSEDEKTVFVTEKEISSTEAVVDISTDEPLKEVLAENFTVKPEELMPTTEILVEISTVKPEFDLTTDTEFVITKVPLEDKKIIQDKDTVIVTENEIMPIEFLVDDISSDKTTMPIIKPRILFDLVTDVPLDIQDENFTTKSEQELITISKFMTTESLEETTKTEEKVKEKETFTETEDTTTESAVDYITTIKPKISITRTRMPFALETKMVSTEILDENLKLKPELELTTVSGIATTESYLEESTMSEEKQKETSEKAILTTETGVDDIITVQQRIPITMTEIPFTIETGLPTTEFPDEISTVKPEFDVTTITRIFTTENLLDETTQIQEKEIVVVTEIKSFEETTKMEEKQRETSEKVIYSTVTPVDDISTIKPKIPISRTEIPLAIETDMPKTEIYDEVSTIKPEFDLTTFTGIITTESLLEETTMLQEKEKIAVTDKEIIYLEETTKMEEKQKETSEKDTSSTVTPVDDISTIKQKISISKTAITSAMETDMLTTEYFEDISTLKPEYDLTTFTGMTTKGLLEEATMIQEKETVSITEKEMTSTEALVDDISTDKPRIPIIRPRIAFDLETYAPSTKVLVQNFTMKSEPELTKTFEVLTTKSSFEDTTKLEEKEKETLTEKEVTTTETVVDDISTIKPRIPITRTRMPFALETDIPSTDILDQKLELKPESKFTTVSQLMTTELSIEETTMIEKPESNLTTIYDIITHKPFSIYQFPTVTKSADKSTTVMNDTDIFYKTSFTDPVPITTYKDSTTAELSTEKHTLLPTTNIYYSYLPPIPITEKQSNISSSDVDTLLTSTIVPTFMLSDSQTTLHTDKIHIDEHFDNTTDVREQEYLTTFIHLNKTGTDPTIHPETDTTQATSHESINTTTELYEVSTLTDNKTEGIFDLLTTSLIDELVTTQHEIPDEHTFDYNDTSELFTEKTISMNTTLSFDSKTETQTDDISLFDTESPSILQTTQDSFSSTDLLIDVDAKELHLSTEMPFDIPHLHPRIDIKPLISEAISEKETSVDPYSHDLTTEEITGKEHSLQTEKPGEEQTEKSTTVDDSSLFVTDDISSQTDKVEVTTSHVDKIPTQIYTDDLMLITTDKSMMETTEKKQEIDTTKIQTDKPLITTYPEVSLEQDSSTVSTTEGVSVIPEEQTEPLIVQTTVTPDVDIEMEVETTVPIEEHSPVTPSVTEEESTEFVTESTLDTEIGKYTSKPDISTSTYEVTSDLVDETTTKKTIVETTTLIEGDIFTELPTTMTPDAKTTDNIYEKPIDIPENKTLFESKPVTELPVVEEDIVKEEPSKKCVWSNATYEHGASVPPDSECQDFCKCDNGTVKCKHRACPPVPPTFLRCAASSSSNNTCCPSYDCGEPGPSDHFCLHEGMIFNNGDYVPSGTECLDCYCLEGEVVCASLECGVPRADCKALVQRNSDCCPILYECSESPVESGDFMISPEVVTDSSTPVALTTKLISQEVSVEVTSGPATEDSTKYSPDLTTIKADTTKDTLVTKPFYPISDTSVQPTDAPKEPSDISRETTLRPIEHLTEAPEEASDISRETTLRPTEQPTEVPEEISEIYRETTFEPIGQPTEASEEIFDIAKETTLAPELKPNEVPEETSELSRETTLRPIEQPTEAPEETSDISRDTTLGPKEIFEIYKETTLKPIEQPTESPEDTSEMSRETTLRPIEQPTQAPEESSDIYRETTFEPIGQPTESPEEISDSDKETTLTPVVEATEAPKEISDIPRETTFIPIKLPTKAPEVTSDISKETTLEPISLSTETPDEISDIYVETTLGPKEILEAEVTSIPDVTEMEDTFTTPSEIMMQSTTKEVQKEPTDSSVKEILTTEGTIDDKPITTDKISVTESIADVSKTTQESLTEPSLDEDKPTEKLTIEPEEIISFEKEKEEDIITSTTTPVTTLSTSKVISDEHTPSSKEPLTTMVISTTTSKEIVEEPSIVAALPEKTVTLPESDEHKFVETELEVPFPPFPGGDFVVEPHIGIPELPVKEKETESEILFSPFPSFPEEPESFPEAKPMEDEQPEIVLPPGIFVDTHIPPQILNETTTWKPTTTTELVLGPGYCLFDRKVYASAEQIPRDDPCDFCFCFRGDIICLQQTCPDAIDGCYEEAIEGFCCPRYECPVRQEIVNITTTTPSPIPGFPPIHKTSRVAMCEIEGKHYASGEVVKSASSPCHECICGTDGFMKCIPKECDTKRKIYKHGYR